jgi:hypothetical protein
MSAQVVLRADTLRAIRKLAALAGGNYEGVHVEASDMALVLHATDGLVVARWRLPRFGCDPHATDEVKAPPTSGDPVTAVFDASALKRGLSKLGPGDRLWTWDLEAGTLAREGEERGLVFADEGHEATVRGVPSAMDRWVDEARAEHEETPFDVLFNPALLTPALQGIEALFASTRVQVALRGRKALNDPFHLHACRRPPAEGGAAVDVMVAPLRRTATNKGGRS